MLVISLFIFADLQSYVTKTSQVHEPETNIELMIKESNHWFLSENNISRKARAGRNKEGQEFIVLNKDMLKDPELQQILEHEIAHIIAWKRYGENIPEHGFKFKKVCREVVTSKSMTYCN